MKKNYIVALFAILCLFVAGCNSESFPTNNAKGKRVTIGASVCKGETRLAFSEEENGGMQFTWSSDDYLYIVNPEKSEVTRFDIIEGVGTTSAKFAGEPVEDYEIGQNLIAIYSKNPDAPVKINTERNGIYIDLAGQDGTLNDKYQYMYGKIVLNDKEPKFTLQSLVSVLKVDITLPKEASELKEAGMYEVSNFSTGAYLMLNDGSLGEDGDYKMGDLLRWEPGAYEVQDEDGNWDVITTEGDPKVETLTISRDIPIVDNKITFYFYVVCPKNWVSQKTLNSWFFEFEYLEDCFPISPMFYLKDKNENVYSAYTKERKEIESGNIYLIELNATDNSLKLDVSVPIEMVEKASLVYTFIPEESGEYEIIISKENEFSDLWSSYLPSSLESGKTYFCGISGTGKGTITIIKKKIFTIHLDEDFVLKYSNDNNRYYYEFTPDKTDYYLLNGVNGQVIFDIYPPEDLNGYLFVGGFCYRFYVYNPSEKDSAASLRIKKDVTNIPDMYHKEW